jgi:hypothetical protein
MAKPELVQLPLLDRPCGSAALVSFTHLPHNVLSLSIK